MIAHISDTARWVAYYRAVEHDRADALFRDPYARALAGPEGQEIARLTRRGSNMAWAMAVRTAAFDALILDAIRRGATRVVDLAAGLDSRPWRLPLPRTLRWVDVDLPEILNYKSATLRDAAPACEYVAMTGDLTSPAERQAVFAALAADPSPTLVLTEGLLLYLTRDDVAELARAVRTLPDARWWLIDIASPWLLKWMQGVWGKAMREGGAEFRFAPEESTRFFEPLGWREAEFRSIGDESRRLGRPIPSAWILRVMFLFLSKERIASFRRMTGFVRLERA